jgi:hypothetical protein
LSSSVWEARSVRVNGPRTHCGSPVLASVWNAMRYNRSTDFCQRVPEAFARLADPEQGAKALVVQDCYGTGRS